ncbi:hypothetical protein AVEN_202668-1, partial [Araneus ventricosus]
MEPCQVLEQILVVGSKIGVGTDISRWEQDRDYGRDVQTPPSGTAGAIVVCAGPHEEVPGVFTEEMLLRMEPFQVLEQVLVVGSKIGTMGGMVKHLPAEPLQQLTYAQRRMRASVVMEQSPSDYHLFSSLKDSWRRHRGNRAKNFFMCVVSISIHVSRKEKKSSRDPPKSYSLWLFALSLDPEKNKGNP